MSNIKSCPFCGKELIINKGYYAHELSLTEPIECYAATWVFRVDDKKSIGLWNTRKPIDEAYKNGYTDAELQCEKVFDEKISKIIDKLNEQITSFSKKDTILYIRHKAYLENIIKMIEEIN